MDSLRLPESLGQVSAVPAGYVVGAPLDVTVAEVAIESFYLADAEAAAALHVIGK